MIRPRVTLFGREGCCLCDEARELLERVRAEIPFDLEERDIEADGALHAAMLERIPVVAVDGEEAFELLVPEDALRARLADAARAGGRAGR